jgi:hypothetical protein
MAAARSNSPHDCTYTLLVFFKKMAHSPSLLRPIPRARSLCFPLPRQRLAPANPKMAGKTEEPQIFPSLHASAKSETNFRMAEMAWHPRRRERERSSLHSNSPKSFESKN